MLSFRQKTGRFIVPAYSKAEHGLIQDPGLGALDNLCVGLPTSSICTYLRFRLGTHNLQVELGRWHNRRPRCQRVCDQCDMHAVDDVWHLVLSVPHLTSGQQGNTCRFRCARHDGFHEAMRSDGSDVPQTWLVYTIKPLADVDRSFDVDLCEEPDSYDSDDD